MLALYPEITPYNEVFLKVDETHTIYLEESGNPKGEPILFVHGGPGSGTEVKNRRYFDPTVFRIILFDQRGCGKSRPFSSLVNNTTYDLVEDMEKIRKHLKIDKWILFGGSWGSTLSLSYAIKHFEHVKSLILRGIFLCSKKDLDWFFKEGANNIYPDIWEKFIEQIPKEERSDLILAYNKRLTSEKTDVRKKAAIAWARYEASLAKLKSDHEYIEKISESHHADAVARIECHYFLNKGFFKEDDYLIKNAGSIKHIPTIIIHGRYDMICPFINAYRLHGVLPNSKMKIINDAGHSASEEGISDALISATIQFSR